MSASKKSRNKGSKTSKSVDSLMINEALGSSLRLLRKSKKISQTTIGEVLGLDQSAVCRVEKGTQALSPEQLYRMARYFEISLDALFEGNVDSAKA